MASSSRKIPRGGKPARRPVQGGGRVDGYLLNGSFHAFETGSYVFTGSAVEDSSVSYDSSSGSGSGSGSYDSGPSTTSPYDSGSSSSSYDSGSSW